MKKPSTPNQKSVQTSNAELWSAKTPIEARLRMTAASMYMRILVTSTNTRSITDCIPSIMKLATKKAMKIE